MAHPSTPFGNQFNVSTTPSLLSVPDMTTQSDEDAAKQELVQRVVGFTLAGLTCSGSLFLIVFAAVRLCSCKADLVHGLGVHAGIVGFWQGAYVMVINTVATAFSVVDINPLWRVNCTIFHLTRQLLPSVFLTLTLVLLLAYWTVHFPGRRAVTARWRCLFLLAHATPWIFGLGATLPPFVWRDAKATFSETNKSLLCKPRTEYTNLTLSAAVVARGLPLVAHCLLTLVVTLKRRKWQNDRHIRVAPPRRMPLVVLLYFLVALVTEGSFLVSRIIDIVCRGGCGWPKLKTGISNVLVERSLTWTHYCHFCLAPPLLIFIMVHVSSEFRRIAHALSKKHVLQPPARQELLYTNCMLTSL